MAVPDRTQLRRDEILDAAERVFADKGYHEAGIADIAALLGIGHGTFYRYFKNKHDIAETVLDRAIGRFAAPALAEDPEAAATIDEYREQVERMLTNMFALFDDHPHVMRFFHEESVGVDAERMATALDAYAQFGERFLRNGIEKGFLRDDLDVEVVSQALLGMILEGTRRALRAPDVAATRARWIAAGTALMFEGVAPPARD